MPKLLNLLSFPSSSYYYCKAKPAHLDRYANARSTIKKEFELVRGIRGYRYIRQRLRESEKSICISSKKARALMAEEGCVVSYAKKRRRYGSYEGETGRAPDNFVSREFHADAPNTLWLTDVTQFSIPAGKVYLSPIIDVFDGMPVSWTIRKSPDAKMADTMLEEACRTLGGDETPMMHSDRRRHHKRPG